jgi:hypothetical protein
VSEESSKIDVWLALIDFPLVLPSFEDMFAHSESLVQIEEAIRNVSPLLNLSCKDVESLTCCKDSSCDAYDLCHGLGLNSRSSLVLLGMEEWHGLDEMRRGNEAHHLSQSMETTQIALESMMP